MDYNRWSAGVDPQYPPPPNPNPSSDPYYPHYPHPQSSSYTTHYSSYYPPSNPNTAPPLSSPSHTPLGPPGTESYSSLTPYHPPAAGYSHLAADVGAAAAGYYQEPPVGALSTGVAAGYYKDGTGAGYYQEPTGAHPQSWVVKEAIRQYGADPVAYAPAGTRPPNGIVPSVSTNPVPQFWSNTVSRPPFKNGARQGLNKRKIVQSAWCEVCKIDCTSKEVLDQHKLGKKHKKKVEQLEESKANPTAQTTKKPAIGPQENPAGKGKNKVKSTQDPPEDLETKKRKILEGGAAPDAVKVCEICNVVCNSETVFKFHLAGQKHISLMKQRQSGVVAPGPSAVTAA